MHWLLNRRKLKAERRENAKMGESTLPFATAAAGKSTEST